MTRAFLAIGLPDAVRARLRCAVAELRDDLAGWRWVDVAGIHLTLRFLGEVEPAALARARPVWAADIADVPRFDFRIVGLGTFPPRGRPRVLWAGVRDVRPEGTLVRVARILESSTRRLGFGPEEHPFRPHLTLARAYPGRRATCAADGREFDLGQVSTREGILFASERLPSGARYTVLDRFAFGARRCGIS